MSVRSAVSRSQTTSSQSQSQPGATIRPRRSRPRTAATSTGYGDNDIICALTEARGIPPVVALSFVNLTTSEAVLCQFTDTQTYPRTCLKIKVFSPTEIIFTSTTAESKLVSIVAENADVESGGTPMTNIDRRYWSESSAHEYVERLSIPGDLDPLKLSLEANYYATCCFGAVMKYIELSLGKTFAPQTLRIRFEPSEGSMMMDLSTIASLELVQNLQDVKSRDSLFGLLNRSQTKMGARMLRSNVLQPSTDVDKIEQHHDALGDLVANPDMLLAVRSALESFVDTDKCLSALIQLPTKLGFPHMEQSVNNVLILKTFVDSINPIWQALVGATSAELRQIQSLCSPQNYVEVVNLIKYAINDDVGYAKKAPELRNQRVYAIRAGTNCFLDVARTSYKEINEDVFALVEEMNAEHGLALDLRYDPARQYYLRAPASDFDSNRPIPPEFIHKVQRKKFLEFTTLPLLKLNQKIRDAHAEVISLSDSSIQKLIDAVRTKIEPLFKISESIALLDMLAGWAQLSITNDYGPKPEFTPNTLALKSARHPILSKILHSSYRLIPNDVYATPQNRFQIITGANMSGKSTYIRSVALLSIMTQIGCFIPCEYASYPVFHQLFARISTDSPIESNVSTFASEMREIAFILRNLEPRSLIIIDELGRGTSTTDGLAIAIAIAEALIESRAFAWFVTHFRELPRILAERAGVVNLHLSVDITDDMNLIKMTYKISSGPEETKQYGIALAKAMNLPQDVIKIAEAVSSQLNERAERRSRNGKALAIARRRKLVLALREQLEQARDSMKAGRSQEEMRVWLKNLQDEFVVRLSAIEAEMEACTLDEDCDDNESSTGGTKTAASQGSVADTVTAPSNEATSIAKEE
ncbi:hypothetical protein DV735_g811, partial [Chaetothyriales sp. CBS 134920]